MKKVGSFLAALLLTNPLTTPLALGSEVPFYCKYKPSRGLRPEQEEVCKKFELIENKEDGIAKENIADPLPAVSYPFSSQGAILEEGLPPLFVSVEAKDSALLKLKLVQGNQNENHLNPI